MKRLYGFYDMERAVSTISLCDTLGFENIQSVTMNSFEQLLRNYSHEYLYQKYYNHSLSLILTSQQDGSSLSSPSNSPNVKNNNINDTTIASVVEVDLFEESLSGIKRYHMVYILISYSLY